MNPYHQGQLDFFCAIYAFINAARLLFGVQLDQARTILATALSELSARPEIWRAMLCNRTDHHWVIPYMLGRFCGASGLPVRVACLPEAPMKGLGGAGDKELLAWLAPLPPEPLSLGIFSEGDMYRRDVEFGPHCPLPESKREGPRRPWTAPLLWELLERWLPGRRFMGVFGGGQKQKRCLILRFHRFLPHQRSPFISHWSTGWDFSKESLNLYDCTANKEATHTLPLDEIALYPENVGGRQLLAVEPQSVYFLEKI